mgnify:CR=1 FL=1
MKRYILRFYRKFFSRKGRNSIKRLVYFGLMFWFLSIFVQRCIYPEYILTEWYYFYLIYCSLFYIGIMFLPWTRYTLLSKLRIFQIFSFASVFVLITTVESLYGFFILNHKPCTAYSVYQVALRVLYEISSL